MKHENQDPRQRLVKLAGYVLQGIAEEEDENGNLVPTGLEEFQKDATTLAESVITILGEKPVMREGYWRTSDKNSTLPKPVANKKPWKGKKKFLDALRKKQALAYHQSYKGWSNCRCCGRKNGEGEYQLLGWQWPDGYAHYVEKHNVRPSLAFQEFVLGEHLT